MLAIFCHWLIWTWIKQLPESHWMRRNSLKVKRTILGIAIVAASGLLLQVSFVWQYLPGGTIMHWYRGGAVIWAMIVVGTTIVLYPLRFLPLTEDVANPGRRQLLKAAKTLVVASPALATGFGVFVERRSIHLVTQDIHIRGLHPDLNGFKITQISDIHLSPFLSERELAYAVDMANSTKPHLMVMTGDLITREGDPLDTCIAHLGRLRADYGSYGCNGNHEIYAKCEDYVEQECGRRGLHMLRQKRILIQPGNARLNLAGVDYQRGTNPNLNDAADLLDARSGALNILISHNPAVFDNAAAQGWDLTLAGHTHGGQVSVEILHQHVNLARFYSPYTYGKYQKGKSQIFVTRGVGTVGMPARIGAPPEVAAIRLWSA